MKKQFRLYDIYRTATTGNMSVIKGLKCYDAKILLDGDIKIYLLYDNDSEWVAYYKNEDELKVLVREVNKRLGNCRKPGKKKGQKKTVTTSGYYPNVTR